LLPLLFFVDSFAYARLLALFGFYFSFRGFPASFKYTLAHKTLDYAHKRMFNLGERKIAEKT